MFVRSLRSAAVASCLVLSVGLAGCGEDSSSESQTPVSAPSETAGSDPSEGSGDDTSSEGSEGTLKPACAAFADTSRELAEAGTKLFSGSEDEIDTVIAALGKQLDAVKEGAPQSVKDAADELKEAYTTIGEAASNPSGEAAEPLSNLGERLGKASQTVANYITSVCTR